MRSYVTDTHSILWYILKSKRLSQKSIDKVIDLLDIASTNYRLSQISIKTIRAMQTIPRKIVADMPDRIIAATAIELGLPLISRDKNIKKSDLVEIIW